MVDTGQRRCVKRKGHELNRLRRSEFSPHHYYLSCIKLVKLMKLVITLVMAAILVATKTDILKGRRGRREIVSKQQRGGN